MTIIAAIQNHNGRVYGGIQTLLAAGMASALLAFIIGERSAAVGWALLFCLIATAAGALTLAYLRRSLAFRLEQALHAEEEKQKLLQIDPVTGAATRRFFLEEMKQALGEPLKPRAAILLLVDLDHFKQLNDSFGHQFGDTALSHLVSAATTLFPGAAIGRLGGDEFGILVPGDDVKTARDRAFRLLQLLQVGKPHEGNQISLSVSIGMAVAPTHALDPKELMLVADLALYDSKSAGRGRVTLFDTEMISDRRHRRFLERELRAAVYLNELEMHYQPIVNADGSLFAVEGLVRWRHPVRGLISPGVFIPVAERSGLIDTVGEWVFKQACADLHNFPGCRISINVSGEQLRRDEVVSMFRRVLTQTGCRADRFVIEITETVATGATPEVLKRLETLKAMGFRVALDDFGTGHCGFNYLQSLPIDSIKIDRSYVHNLATDGVAQIFVSALTQIARLQNLTIVAEGVETEAEFELAKAAGCNRFQGYLFGRPEPVKTRLARIPAPMEDAAGQELRLTA